MIYVLCMLMMMCGCQYDCYTELEANSGHVQYSKTDSLLFYDQIFFYYESF